MTAAIVLLMPGYGVESLMYAFVVMSVARFLLGIAILSTND